MKTKEVNRLLFFLRHLELLLEGQEETLELPKLLTHYTDSELREMIHWFHKESWSKNALGFIERDELEKLITTDYQVLLWTIAQLEKQTFVPIDYSQQEVDSFFRNTYNEIHYLASKDSTKWDSYDKVNYHSLRTKAGKIYKAFIILPASKRRTNPLARLEPKDFFDTREEAAKAIQAITKEKATTINDYIIDSVWLRR